MSVEEMLVALAECVGPDGTRLMPEIHPDVAMQIRYALKAGQAMRSDLNNIPSHQGMVHPTNKPGAKAWDAATGGKTDE